MYILLCNDGSYYTGSTSNLHKRIKQHFAGEGANHTKKHPPVKLLYYEEFSRIDDAFYREKQVQGWSRKKKEALINGEYEKLPELSKSYSKRSVVPSTSSGTTSTKETVPSTSSGTGVLSVAEPVEATVTSSGTDSTKKTVPSTSSGTTTPVAEPVEATVETSIFS